MPALLSHYEIYLQHEQVLQAHCTEVAESFISFVQACRFNRRKLVVPLDHTGVVVAVAQHERQYCGRRSCEFEGYGT